MIDRVRGGRGGYFILCRKNQYLCPFGKTYFFVGGPVGKSASFGEVVPTLGGFSLQSFSNHVAFSCLRGTYT